VHELPRAQPGSDAWTERVELLVGRHIVRQRVERFGEAGGIVRAHGDRTERRQVRADREQHAPRARKAPQRLTLHSEVRATRFDAGVAWACGGAVQRLVQIVGVEHAPAEAPEAALRRQPLEEAVDRVAELGVEPGNRRVDVGEGETELRAQVPPVREAHAAATDDEPPAALDEEHEVLLHEAAGRVERVDRAIGFDVAESLGDVHAEMVDERVQHFRRFVDDIAGEDDRRLVMVAQDLPLDGDVAVVALVDLDPVVEFERMQPETPPERPALVRLVVRRRHATSVRRRRIRTVGATVTRGGRDGGVGRVGHVLIGRSAEMDAAMTAWRKRQRGVLVTGPPGIGRTSFLTEVAARLRVDGADVMHVRGTVTSRAVRLWALASHLVDDVHGGTDLAEAVWTALLGRASGRLAVVVDDGHLLDDASTRMLADLLDAPHGFVIVTATDRDVDGPLLAHAGLQPLSLAPLDVAGVAALLSAHGVHDVHPAAAHERSGGNPTALLRLLVVWAGRTDASGLSVGGPLPGPAQAAPSALGHDAIDAVLAGTSAPVRRLLDTVAVAEPLAVEAVDAVLGRTGNGATAAAIDDLLRTGLVERTTNALGQDELRFVHPSDAALVIDLMAPLQTRSVVRRAVRAAVTTGDRRTPESLVRLASLATRVGERLDADELRAAAAAARGGDDGEVALRLARATADATGAYADVRVWADLAYERGALDDLDIALEQLRGLVACEDEEESARRATAFAVASAERALWRQGDPAAAIAALDAVTGGPGRDELIAVRARVLATVGSTRKALDQAVPLLEHGDARVRAQAAVAVCHARRRRGSPTAGVAALDAMLAAPGADDTVLLVSRRVLGAVRSLALTEAGRWHEAEVTADEARASADRADDRAGRAVALLVLAAAWCSRGRTSSALATARRSLEMFEQLAQPAGVRWAWGVIGLAAGLGGDAATAITATDRLRELPPHPATLLPAIEPLAQAWAAVHASPDAARRILSRAAADLAAAEDLAAAAQCLHELAVLGDAVQALDGLRRLETDAREPLTAVRREHVAAVAADDYEALGRLAGTYTALGGDRWAVECAAAAGSAAARVGDRRAAAEWSATAVELASTCEGLATPGLAGARIVHKGAAPLTARERDVALLAARGVPSREIAERLGLSVRTVDNHLARCFDKLGVRNRGELAPLLGVDA
jgi:DNA-binding CsgD family transcriptional regulator/tetratricopeptide (TPR) repeat protein